jgi:hypothetical protein
MDRLHQQYFFEGFTLDSRFRLSAATVVNEVKLRPNLLPGTVNICRKHRAFSSARYQLIRRSGLDTAGNRRSSPVKLSKKIFGECCTTMRSKSSRRCRGAATSLR